MKVDINTSTHGIRKYAALSDTILFNETEVTGGGSSLNLKIWARRPRGYIVAVVLDTNVPRTYSGTGDSVKEALRDAYDRIKEWAPQLGQTGIPNVSVFTNILTLAMTVDDDNKNLE